MASMNPPPSADLLYILTNRVDIFQTCLWKIPARLVRYNRSAEGGGFIEFIFMISNAKIEFFSTDVLKCNVRFCISHDII